MLDKYYLGIDGGGSKTAFAIINQDNELVYYKETGPSSLDTVSKEVLRQILIEGVEGFNYQVEGIFAGLGGISNQEQIYEVKEILKTLKVCKESTKVDAGNDVINALYGSLGGEDGIVLIAGTGSVCYGKKGETYHRAGGYCYQEGDAGSGYDLGMKALQHLARVLDKRHEESEFSKALSNQISCYDYSSLASYFINSTRTEKASLSRVVTKYQDDKYARSIIEHAVNEVLLMIKAVFNTLNYQEEKVLFSVIGSLGNADTLYKELLLEGLINISSNIVFIPKRYEAYIGSALKAKEV